MFAFLYKFFFTKLGWTIRGEWPKDLKKFIIVVAPHTSNWDFMIGLCVRSITNLESGFLGKKELFRFPFGWLFRKLGGHPVERSKSTNFVDAVTNIFNSEEQFVVAIAPEGTRKYSPNWKTGFFYISQKAQVPIVPVAIDYPSKSVIIDKPLNVEGDVSVFIDSLQSWFSNYTGKVPEFGVRPTSTD